MSLTSTQGVIVLSGNVDGVDFAALRNLVVSHHANHVLVGNVDNVSETLTVAGNFRTATTSAGGSPTTETAYFPDSPRVHNHGLFGTLAASTTVQSGGIAPAGTATTLNGTNGNIECNTVDGYAPEDQWSRYTGHSHAISGDTDWRTLGPHTLLGSSGRAWFYVRPEGGGGEFWAQITTASGDHRHAAGSLVLAALGAGAAPTAAGSEAKLDGANGHVITDGNVNGVDVSAFNTHVRNFGGGVSANGRHQGSGTTGDGGAAASVLRDAATGNPVEFYSGTSWVGLQYMTANPGVHTHGGTSISGRAA